MERTPIFLPPTSLSLSLSLWQLEDDIVARPNYFTTMKNFALQQPLEEWMILEFSQLGFIGESAVGRRLSAARDDFPMRGSIWMLSCRATRLLTEFFILTDKHLTAPGWKKNSLSVRTVCRGFYILKGSN